MAVKLPRTRPYFSYRVFVLLNNHQYSCNITKSFLSAVPLGYGSLKEWIFVFICVICHYDKFMCMFAYSSGLASINFSLFGTLAISFFILHSIDNLMSFLLYWIFASQVHVSFLLHCYISNSLVWHILLLFLIWDLRYLSFDMDPIQHMHIPIVISPGISRPAPSVLNNSLENQNIFFGWFIYDKQNESSSIMSYGRTKPMTYILRLNYICW